MSSRAREFSPVRPCAAPHLPADLCSRSGVFLSLLVCLLSLSGCSRLRPRSASNYVYVTAKETFLRDRIAAVSNRTATVKNGERLKVLEHGRRFYRVQTDKGVQGWIDDKIVATQAVYDAFQDLKKQHANDPVVANGVTYDEVYMHVRPGREADHLYRLKENEKLQLLKRATLPRYPPGKGPNNKVSAVYGAPVLPAPPVMEDWWLVRDTQGDTGWMLSRMIDISIPETIMRYSEGQRVVGAYVLTHVNDPEAPSPEVPIYLTVTAPPKAGLPYDFDQVRLFTWNIRKHRYETGFRDRNIEGYLPVEIMTSTDPGGKTPLSRTPLPAFRYRVLAADAPTVLPNLTTGEIHPGKTILKTYRLEGNIVQRILPPGQTAPEEAHPIAPKEKKERRRHRR